MPDFSGKTVIITGAGAGIGKAAAVSFAAQGAKLVVVNSKSDTCSITAREIERLGCTAKAIRGDASNPLIVSALFDAAEEADILVNCAGVVPQGNVETTDLEEWDEVWNTNVKSVFLNSREFLNRRKRNGVIVNVASVAGFKGIKNRALYSATKGAVIALTKSMAVEYVADGWRINAISPGTVYSPSLQHRIEAAANPSAEKQMFESRQPMGRLGTPEEIAQAILFLASPNNTYMTGVNLVCDGGATV